MEKLTDLPTKDTKHTKDEAELMDQFFPDNEQDTEKGFFEKLDLKKGFILTVVFAVLANPWVDGIISKIPYFDNPIMTFVMKCFLFYLVVSLMNILS